MDVGPGRSAATIGDVADRAQVSRATVSRVMNGKVSVDPALALRVRTAAEELHYRPSTTARSLSLGRTETVAVVLPDLTNPMFQEILRGTSLAAAGAGYRVLVADSAGDPEQERLVALDARARCDAVVLVSPQMPAEALALLLPELEPVVLVNRQRVGAAPAVGVDYAAGILALLEHLHRLGHRHLLYLAGPERSESNAVRLEALRRYAASHDVVVSEVRAGSTVEAGYAIGGEVLASRCSAVVCYNDLVAFGLLARLNELGVAVPGDISITGFDDISIARFAQPPLTTASVAQADLGRRAWDLLEHVLEGHDPGGDPDPMTPHLVVRSSTGVVPARPASGTGARLSTPAVRAVDSLAWQVDGEEHVLAATLDDGDRLDLVRTGTGLDIPAVHSPRPYLHPVRTLGGHDLTDRTPVDHRHHYGVSMAVAQVNGTSYWGGRTYVRGEGPTLLPNHGRQRLDSSSIEAGALHQHLTWIDEQEKDQLTERRTIEGTGLAPGAWAVRWVSDLAAEHGEVVIESPATNGRQGAGYGGLFWRLGPASVTTVTGAGLVGEAQVHGSSSPWLAFTQHRGDHAATLLLVQPPELVLPWFVRVSEYPGAGPSLAWDAPRVVPAGSVLRVGLAGVAVDGVLEPERAAELAAQVWQR